MLNLAKESVGAIELDTFSMSNQFEAGEGTQRVQRIRFLQERMATAVNELQCLDDKLDLANAAAPELHISLEISGKVVLDPALDARNFVEQIRRRTARIDQRLVLPQTCICELAATGDAARLYQRHPLPGFAGICLIILHALERARERARRTSGTKTKVDSEKSAFRIRCGKRFDNCFRKTIEPFVVRESGRYFALFGIEKDKIDISTVIELTAAKFSQS